MSNDLRVGRNEREEEANYFAAHLLVPTRALHEAYRKLGPVDMSSDGDEALKKLAKHFGVSTTLMAMRIAEEAF